LGRKIAVLRSPFGRKKDWLVWKLLENSFADLPAELAGARGEATSEAGNQNFTNWLSVLNKIRTFFKKIRTLTFDPPTGEFRSGGQKGRGLGGRNFCPPSLFRRRRISFFASQKAPQEKVLLLPQPSRARATGLLPCHHNLFWVIPQ